MLTRTKLRPAPIVNHRCLGVTLFTAGALLAAACEGLPEDGNTVSDNVEDRQAAIRSGTVATSSTLFPQSTVEFAHDQFGGGCTGTIISARHVLTAAHCDDPNKEWVRFYDNNGLPTQTLRKVLQIYQDGVQLNLLDSPDPNDQPIDGRTYLNDWKVLYLDQDIPTGYTPAQLATTPLPVGSTGYQVGVSGDGASIGFGVSMRYHTATTRTYSEHPALGGIFVADDWTVGGDSGGPFYTYTDSSKTKLIVHGDLLAASYTSTSLQFEKIMAATGLRTFTNSKVAGTNLGSAITVSTARDCAARCRINKSCKGYNYAGGTKSCQFLSSTGSTSSSSGNSAGVFDASGPMCMTHRCTVSLCQADSGANCGGTTCPKCSLGQSCTSNSDCLSNSCVNKVCSPAPVQMLALNRYYSGSVGRHWVTTGSVSAGYNFERRMGYAMPTGGSGLHALYGCRLGTNDYFISLRPDCEGRSYLRTEGYAYDGAGTGRVQLFRCRYNGGHFVSASSDCEGQGIDGPMGYFPTDQLAIFYGTDTDRRSTPPNDDWSSGNSKATCDHAEAAVGFDVPMDHSAGHALLCKNPGKGLAGSQTAVLPATSENRRATRSDWGGGLRMLECSINEYVSGVSQTRLQSGKLGGIQAVRCSSSSGVVTNGHCEAHLIDGSRGYTGAWGDWDWSYEKADCPQGQVMVGLGVVGASTQRPRRILCCDLKVYTNM